MGYVTLSESTHTSTVNHGENGHSKVRITNPHSRNLCTSDLQVWRTEFESKVPPCGKSYRGSIIPFLSLLLDHRELKPPFNQELHEREIHGQWPLLAIFRNRYHFLGLLRGWMQPHQSDLVPCIISHLSSQVSAPTRVQVQAGERRGYMWSMCTDPKTYSQILFRQNPLIQFILSSATLLMVKTKLSWPRHSWMRLFVKYSGSVLVTHLCPTLCKLHGL